MMALTLSPPLYSTQNGKRMKQTTKKQRGEREHEKEMEEIGQRSHDQGHDNIVFK